MKEDQFFYAQIPLELLESDLLDSAKALFATYHSFCRNKDLRSHPTTNVGRKKVSERMRKSVDQIYFLDKLLIKAGWITKRPRPGKSSITTLYPTPRMKRID